LFSSNFPKRIFHCASFDTKHLNGKFRPRIQKLPKLAKKKSLKMHLKNNKKLKKVRN